MNTHQSFRKFTRKAHSHYRLIRVGFKIIRVLRKCEKFLSPHRAPYMRAILLPYLTDAEYRLDIIEEISAQIDESPIMTSKIIEPSHQQQYISMIKKIQKETASYIISSMGFILLLVLYWTLPFSIWITLVWKVFTSF